MVDLGAIERVALKDVWPHEAQDFTPWLADNLDKLGEALGLDLEFREREAAVGSFSLDVLAHDVGGDRPVIIENQLGTTDHNHLGQLLTYAAGYDAGVVVWLTADFRDEHRAALDWLNLRTGEDTQFFGVVVEAWKIDLSRPAPHFKVLAMPNGWQKQTAAAAKAGKSANAQEIGERQRQFFQPLIDTCREDYQLTNAKNAHPKNWQGFKTGVKGFGLIARIGHGSARVELYIDCGDPGVNKDRFDHLESIRDNIEGQFETDLVWQRLDHARASHISLAREGATVDDTPAKQDETRKWLECHLLKFKEVFVPHIEEMVQQEAGNAR